MLLLPGVIAWVLEMFLFAPCGSEWREISHANKHVERTGPKSCAAGIPIVPKGNPHSDETQALTEEPGFPQFFKVQCDS